MIKKIIAKNFFSWEHLEFGVRSGVTLIDGMNHDDNTGEGSGKSSLTNAISWGLYGKVPKDINIDDVVRHGEKKCEVEVHLDNGIIIHRKRKPNDLFYVKDGKEIRGKDSNSTQKGITELIGISFEAFTHTCYQSQNNQSRFIVANQEDKAKILSEIIELDIFDRARKLAHEQLKECATKSSDTSHQLELLTKDTFLLNKELELEEQKIQAKREAHFQEMQNIKGKVSAAKSNIDNMEYIFKLEKEQYVEAVKSNKKEWWEAEALVAEKQKQLDQIYPSLLESKSKLISDSRIQSGRDKLSQQKALISNHTQVESLRTQRVGLAASLAQQLVGLNLDLAALKSFVKNPEKKCPTCSTLLKECDTTEAVGHILKLEVKVGDLKDQISRIELETSAPIQDISDIEKKVEGIQKALSQALVLEREFRELEGMVSGIERSLQNLKVELGIRKDIYDRSSSKVFPHEAVGLRDLKMELISQEHNLMRHSKLKILGTSDQITNIQGELVKLDVESKNLNTYLKNNSHQIVILSELKNNFKFIKSYIFEGLLQELNYKVNAYLEELFEVSASLSFRNDGGKIITEVTLGGVDFKLGLLSGGQFRRVALAVDLALNDVLTSRKGSGIGVLILDEYFKDLSEESMAKCLNLLTTREQPILLIEHNTIFKSILDQTFFVELRGGVSEGVPYAS